MMVKSRLSQQKTLQMAAARLKRVDKAKKRKNDIANRKIKQEMAAVTNTVGASDTVEEMFQKIVSEVEKDRQLRDGLYDIARSIETVNRGMLTTLQATHSNPQKPEVEIAVVRGIIKHDSLPLVKQLSETVPIGLYYKYNDIFRYAMQRLSFIVTFTSFLETGQLVDRSNVAQQLGLEVKEQQGFHLDLEDYLMGVLNLAGELARYSVNAVTAGDTARPFQIAPFVKRVDEMFRLLNLKNDMLRKRFDALKYDVQKCEQVVYDLTIRGLKSTA